MSFFLLFFYSQNIYTKHRQLYNTEPTQIEVNSNCNFTYNATFPTHPPSPLPTTPNVLSATQLYNTIRCTGIQKWAPIIIPPQALQWTLPPPPTPSPPTRTAQKGHSRTKLKQGLWHTHFPLSRSRDWLQQVEPRKASNQHNYFVARTNRHQTTDFTTISTHRKRQLNNKRRKGAEDSMCI